MKRFEIGDKVHIKYMSCIRPARVTAHNVDDWGYNHWVEFTDDIRHILEAVSDSPNPYLAHDSQFVAVQ